MLSRHARRREMRLKLIRGLPNYRQRGRCRARLSRRARQPAAPRTNRMSLFFVQPEAP